MNFNLCGSVFEMDEDVWKKLKAYIESIKSSLGSTGLEDDVAKDIEIRITEVLNQRAGPAKRKLTSEDIDHVISTIGNPQDFGTSMERSLQETSNQGPVRKRLVKTPDDKVVFGVCGGIADYFGFDPIFLRVPVALAAVFTGGVVILVYFICGFAMPEGPTRKTIEQISVQNLKTKQATWALAIVLIIATIIILVMVTCF